MNTHVLLTLFKDALVLVTFVAATASTVTVLALAYPQPAPAVVVLALMTPIIASAAVQFYHHLRPSARPPELQGRG